MIREQTQQALEAVRSHKDYIQIIDSLLAELIKEINNKPLTEFTYDQFMEKINILDEAIFKLKFPNF